MKKILILVLFVAVGFISMAQSIGDATAFVPDTTTNSETEYLVLSSPKDLTQSYYVGIGVTPTNESGTATVTAMPQGNLNGSWYDLAASADTVNNAGTVASKSYTYLDAYYEEYRVKLVSTGTGVTSFTGEILLKKK